MFGLFKKKLSEKDQMIVNDGFFYLTSQLPGIDEKFAMKIANVVFDKSKEIALRDFGSDVYTEGLGARMLETDLGKKRLADGVKPDEIVEYWNKTPLQIVFDNQIEAGRMMGYVKTYKGDNDEAELIQPYFWIHVRFGMPEFWDLSAVGNSKFTLEDAPLYSELRPRVEKFMRVHGSVTQLSATANSSINAELRKYMRDGLF